MTEKIQPAEAKPETMEESSPQPSAFSRIMRVIFRILVAIVVGIALGAGLYFGAVRGYREVIEPIQSYEARIGDLEQAIDRLRSDAQSDEAEISTRQIEIEGRLAAQSETIASVEALIESTQADLREQRRLVVIIEEMSEEIEDLTLTLGTLSLRLEDLEEDVTSGDLPAQKVQRTAIYLRAMTLLTRARQELDRDNLGFAREQVETAQVTLDLLKVDDGLSETDFGDEQILGDIQERLNLILLDLPDRPEVAGEELEAVWRLFLEAMQPVQLDESDAGGE